MKKFKVEVTFTEDLLGTANANPDIHREFIADNAPTEEKAEEEVAAIDPEAAFEKAMTVFPRTPEGLPAVFDYQWKGYFKDAVGMLRKVPGTSCSKCKAYKKEIDGLIFVAPRMIPIRFDGEMGICQRPLRAQTMQGERVALVSSESIPAGAKMTFMILLMCDAHEAMVKEALDYGCFRGFGQWRNSGKGRFTYTMEEIVAGKEQGVA